MNDTDVNGSDGLAFVVKRRQQDADTGQTATFTVRVETDRSGPDHFLEHWTDDTSTGRVYRDYPLELTGTDLEIKEQFQITNNSESETNWGYWASLRTVEDHEGRLLSSAEQAEYWTVRTGFRETTIDATDGGASNGTISIDSSVTSVVEGGAATFSVRRNDGPSSQPVIVQVRTTEDNPSTQYHDATIQPWEAAASSWSTLTSTGSPRPPTR